MGIESTLTCEAGGPTSPSPIQSKAGAGGGWHCTRNLVLKSLALAMILHLLLTSSYRGRSISAIDSLDENQSMASSRHNQSGDARARGKRDREPEEGSTPSLEVPSAFTIRPNYTFAVHRGGSVLETFHSFVPLRNNAGYQLVYKVNTKDPTLSSGRAQSIETMRLSPSFERIESTRRTLGPQSYEWNGNLHNESGLSDPRAFFWNESAYALTWRQHGHDYANFLFNLITGEEYPLNECVRGYRGKNWVPLVYKEQLYVIHRLSPKQKWFKFDVHNGCPEPERRREAHSSIDEYRGGTAFVPYGPSSMIAVGHRTINGYTHIPYLIHVDVTDTKIRARVRKRRLLSLEKNWTGIMDPTSLWWDDDGKRLWMGTVRTSGSWKRCYFKYTDECWFNMTIYEVELKYEFTGLDNYTLI